MPLDGNVKEFETKPIYDLANSARDRCLFMADFMEGLRDDQVWMDGYSRGMRDECGFAACMLGWAVTCPELSALPGFPKTSAALHQESSHWFGMEYGKGRVLPFHRVINRAEYPAPPTGPEVAARLRAYAALLTTR